jgi:hypothetical protein
MASCCPQGHGCNAPDGAEPCALDLFSAAAADSTEATLALKRWAALQRACANRRTEGERRFRRRAYERARDRALVTLALHPSPPAWPRRLAGHCGRSGKRPWRARQGVS